MGVRRTWRKEATMLRKLLAAAVLSVLALPITASGSPIVPQLTAKVTARSIAVVGADGTRIRVLQPNNYRFIVRDRTTRQNFHLVGPGLNLRTRVPARTTATWSVNLRPGTYTYRSDKNTRLRGSFIVAGAPPA
jgi:hypothetical protein